MYVRYGIMKSLMREYVIMIVYDDVWYNIYGRYI